VSCQWSRASGTAGRAAPPRARHIVHQAGKIVERRAGRPVFGDQRRLALLVGRNPAAAAELGEQRAPARRASSAARGRCEAPVAACADTIVLVRLAIATMRSRMAASPRSRKKLSRAAAGASRRRVDRGRRARAEFPATGEERGQSPASVP
jgi:hypothetical protein